MPVHKSGLSVISFTLVSTCQAYLPMSRLLRRLCSLSVSKASPANSSIGLVPSGHLLACATNTEQQAVRLHSSTRGGLMYTDVSLKVGFKTLWMAARLIQVQQEQTEED